MSTTSKTITKTVTRIPNISVGVSYGEELERVSDALKKAINTLDFLKQDKETEVFVLEFGESSVNYSVRYWIEYPNSKIDYFAAIDRGIKAIKSTFQEENILIPFPIRTLDFNAKGGENLTSTLARALAEENDTQN